MGRLLLQSPGLAAAPLLRRAVEVAAKASSHAPVQHLRALVAAAAPVLDGARANCWEAYSAFESWSLRHRRLELLAPLRQALVEAEEGCSASEAVAKLTEAQELPLGGRPYVGGAW